MRLGDPEKTWARTFVPAALGLSLLACQPAARNLTPPRFPATGADAPTPENALNTATTPPAWYTLAGDPAHRFILEVAPRNATIRGVRANVNGAWYPMTSITNTSLYTFAVPNECNPNYSYQFAVDYGPSWYQQELRVDSNGSPFQVTVTGSGHLVWWPPFGDAQTGNGNARITNDTANNETHVFVQNLGPLVRRIEGVAFGSTPDAAKFTQIERPTVPFDMICGAKTRITVRWTPQPPDFNDTIDMGIITSTQVGGSGSPFVRDPAPLIITINGVPHPS